MLHQLPWVVHYAAASPIDTSGANTFIRGVAFFAANFPKVILFALGGLAIAKGENLLGAIGMGMALAVPTALPNNSDAWTILLATLFTVDVGATAGLYGVLTIANPASKVHHHALGLAALIGGIMWVLITKGITSF